MKTKIVVIGGTNQDTNFGKIFLKDLGYKKILGFAIAETPEEQNKLQYRFPELLFKKCSGICKYAKNNGFDTVLVYCNSLSSVLDIQKLEKQNNINVITPIKVYEDIGKRYKNICILAANSTGAVLVEKEISEYGTKSMSIGFLEIVKKIEEKITPQEIVKKLHLKNVIEFIQSNKFDIILLACTHFPYIKNYLQSISKINIVDLNDGIKKLLEEK